MQLIPIMYEYNELRSPIADTKNVVQSNAKLVHKSLLCIAIVQVIGLLDRDPNHVVGVWYRKEYNESRSPSYKELGSLCEAHN